MKQANAYNTNLAAEYYVLSMLYRKGFDAYLTLGNKKSVDIVIDNGKNLVTVDVKGLAGSTGWPMDNFKKRSANHFIVLVSFLNKIKEHSVVPECWIVPSKDISKLLYHSPSGNRCVIQRGKMKNTKKKYLNRWDLL